MTRTVGQTTEWVRPPLEWDDFAPCLDRIMRVASPARCAVAFAAGRCRGSALRCAAAVAEAGWKGEGGGEEKTRREEGGLGVVGYVTGEVAGCDPF